MPLADLLSSNPYEIFMADVLAGHYVGLHKVDVHECHHLAFEQDEIDWQIWIDAGDNPVPRKLVITYTTLPSHPQYIMTLIGSISFDTMPIPNAFDFTAPVGAEKIDFLPVETGETGSTPDVEDQIQEEEE